MYQGLAAALVLVRLYATHARVDPVVTMDAVTPCVWFRNQVECNVMVPFLKNGLVPFLCLVGAKAGMG